MGQVYQCWWRICREVIFFSDPSTACFAFYIHFWPIYWLSRIQMSQFTTLTTQRKSGTDTVHCRVSLLHILTDTTNNNT
jgi:hypothetical protein